MDGTDTNFCATCLAPILRVIGGSVHQAQTNMMNMRWKFYNFTHVFTEKAIKHYPTCGKCFAELILDY